MRPSKPDIPRRPLFLALFKKAVESGADWRNFSRKNSK
jgi:hypothetical protein